MLTNTRSTSSTRQVGWDDGLHILPVRKLRSFRRTTSINQNYWNQRVAAVEKLSVFDDRQNEELENDVRSFEDQTTLLTTAVLRRRVEMSML